jgi:predicted AlkP superfamily phosphohydrolase/phosphomutase
VTSAGPGTVIAICIEVLSPDLLTGWLQAGWMPNLARLCREGVWSRIASVAEVSSGCIWPTFFTGVNPARHGQFFTHMQIEPGTYSIVKKYADDVPCEPFWRELERYGRSSAIIDVPQTRPLKDFNGIHIAGWGGEYAAWPRSSSPRKVISEVTRRFGTHPLADRYRVALKPETQEQYGRLYEDLLHGCRAKAELSRWVFDQGPHDLFLTVFSEPHWAMHLLWDGLDTGHPSHNVLTAGGCKRVFRELLGIIDGMIGDLRQTAPGAPVLVFSLSGMGPNYSGWHILPQVLERIGMSAEGAPVGSLRTFLPTPRWGSWKTRALEGLVSVRAIEMAKALVPARFWDRWTRRILYAGAGWQQSKAFCVPNDYSGAVRINLKGREPNGRVEPGAEYERLCEEITESLLELEHLESGRPVVREVVRTSRTYSGEHLSALPDLLVLWTSESIVTGVRSARVGKIELDFPERRTGAHRPWGFFAASGPRIRQGVTLDQIDLLDLAPTIMHLTGVRPPEHYDGRVVTELLDHKSRD